MWSALAQRGPDGEGLFLSGNAGMVYRRLAIIDLVGGDQPIASEDESIQVVFNDEIYNSRNRSSRADTNFHAIRHGSPSPSV